MFVLKISGKQKHIYYKVECALSKNETLFFYWKTLIPINLEITADFTQAEVLTFMVFWAIISNGFCIPKGFNTNISHQLFDYTITFVNS